MILVCQVTSSSSFPLILLVLLPAWAKPNHSHLLYLQVTVPSQVASCPPYSVETHQKLPSLALPHRLIVYRPLHLYCIRSMKRQRSFLGRHDFLEVYRPSASVPRLQKAPSLQVVP